MLPTYLLSCIVIRGGGRKNIDHAAAVAVAVDIDLDCIDTTTTTTAQARMIQHVAQVV